MQDPKEEQMTLVKYYEADEGPKREAQYSANPPPKVDVQQKNDHGDCQTTINRDK